MNIYQRSFTQSINTTTMKYFIGEENRNYAKLIINSYFFKGSFKKIISLFKT